MTIPRELSLSTIDGKVTLLQNPVKEILGSAIGDETFTVTPKAIKSGIHLSNEDGHLIEIGYDPSKQEIYLDRSGAWYEIDSTSIHGAPYALTYSS